MTPAPRPAPPRHHIAPRRLRVAACALLAIHAAAQTARLGDLRPSHHVVTQETAHAQFDALHATNALLRAAITNETHYRLTDDAAIRAEIAATNAHARAHADAADAALSNTLHAAIQTESAARQNHAYNQDLHLTPAQSARIAAAITQENDPAALAALAAHTNEAAVHLTPEQSARIAAALTNERRLAALAALAEFAATNRADRLWSQDGQSYILGQGTIWRMETAPVLVRAFTNGTYALVETSPGSLFFSDAANGGELYFSPAAQAWFFTDPDYYTFAAQGPADAALLELHWDGDLP